MVIMAVLLVTKKFNPTGTTFEQIFFFISQVQVL